MKTISQLTLVIFLLLLAILPFLWIAFYCHPSADDYAYAWSTKHIGIVESCQRDYLNWNGRYFSNLLVFLNPISFNLFALYKLVPVVLLITTFFSILILIREIFKNSITARTKIIFSLLVTLLFLIQMPQLPQGIYWYTGAITYQLANILLLLYFTHLLKFLRKEYLLNNSLDLGLLFVQLFCITGFNETVMLHMLILHALVFYKLRTKSLIGLGIFALACSMLVLLSPGNSGRAVFFPQNHQFIHSFEFSVLQTLRFFLTWASSYPLFISSLLFIPFLTELHLKTPNFLESFSLKPLESLGILLLIIFISVFPAYWSMGMLGQHRTLNAACFLFTLFWFVNLSTWIKFYAQHKFMLRLNETLFHYRKWLFAGLVISFFLRGNLLQVVKDLSLGTASNYNSEMQLRYAEIDDCLKSKSKICELDSLKYKPVSIFNFDLTPDENYWINKGEAAYYGLGKIRMKNTKQP